MSNVDEFLAHHGVKGMHWGRHTAGSSGSSSSSGSSGKSRAELKALDRKAKEGIKSNRQAERTARAAEATKQRKAEQDKIDARDRSIVEARGKRGELRQNVKDAKATYKVQRREIGKVAAKQILNKAKNERWDNISLAIQETSREETRRLIRESGGELAAAIYDAGNAYSDARNGR